MRKFGIKRGAKDCGPNGNKRGAWTITYRQNWGVAAVYGGFTSLWRTLYYWGRLTAGHRPEGWPFCWCWEDAAGYRGDW